MRGAFMSGSVNKVILIGNVGQDPEIRSFQSGGKVCNLSIATSERWKDRESKEQKERTQWHRVVVFNENLINLIEMYVKKGSKLFIEGQLETRKWTDASGQEKYSTEVVLRNFKGELTFLDSRSSNNDNDSFESNNQKNEVENSELDQVVNEPSGIDSDIDDDIPF
jgi:single-strand DNA-binding protein